ncbi:hypothetical protein VitviT2T_030642 [Vitis vinifera]|uniref:Phenylalanyl-tRNA synthetase domain-containing protein n=1 Tax=Vitis vinifera TaxID=29760 RepID=A0ABY9E463_VITVI|nr:hypothetical protein VitviT2T_030642 [Vitis vinifera]
MSFPFCAPKEDNEVEENDEKFFLENMRSRSVNEAEEEKLTLFQIALMWPNKAILLVIFWTHLNAINGFSFFIPFSSSSAQKIQTHKWRQPVVSVLELGGVKIGRDDVVRDDPTNNVPDAILSKLGMQLHRRDQHPIGILKNAIYDYFDANYSNKFDKLDDLCPIVSTKENFDDVLVPPDHISRSYNDTYYIDSQTVLRCHTSAHQAELLRRGHTHFLVTGDVYRRDSIDSTHYRVFH